MQFKRCCRSSTFTFVIVDQRSVVFAVFLEVCVEIGFLNAVSLEVCVEICFFLHAVSLKCALKLFFTRAVFGSVR